jgi:hypothetical protein
LWIVHRPFHRPNTELSVFRVSYSLLRDRYVFFDYFRARCPTVVHQRCNGGRTYSAERIDDKIILFGKSENKALDELHRELTGMDGFLDMVRFDIWNFPDIAWIFAERIAREFTLLFPFVIFLIRVFLRNADAI